jgi:hypothetical protein
MENIHTLLLQLQAQNAQLQAQNTEIQAEMLAARNERSTLGNMVQTVMDRVDDMTGTPQTTVPATPTAPPVPIAPAPVVQLPPAREAKGADPEPFSGDRKMTDSFLRAVKLNIALQPRMYSTEVGRILYTLSWMRGGTAGAWAENLTTIMLDPTAPNPYATFSEFLIAFESAFGEPDRTFSARTQLHGLRQGSMSAEEYTAHFDALAGRTGFDEQALIDAYQRGLNPRLLEKIHYTDLPIGLAAWKEKAKKLDNLYRRLQQTTSSATRTPATPARSGATTARPAAPRANPPVTYSAPAAAPAAAAPSAPSWGPMDVDATRRRETRRCYICQQEGHLSRNCPQRRQQTIRTMEDIVRDEVRNLLKSAPTPSTSPPTTTTPQTTGTDAPDF